MEKHTYNGGYFISTVAPNWQEWQQGQLTFHFNENSRDQKWIVLYDASRKIYVSLPTQSGKCYYMWQGQPSWTELYHVTRTVTAAPVQSLNTRQLIINFAEQHIRFGQQFKPLTDEIALYFVSSGALNSIQAAAERGYRLKTGYFSPFWLCGNFHNQAKSKSC